MAGFPLRLPRPDDWHLHLRDGANMASLLQHMPRTMARAIIMPNLRPPVRTTADAVAYRDRILAALPPGSDFTPLMTLYLTDNTTPEEITAARAAGVVAAKLYPAGATTNSDAGVTDVARCAAALARMAEVGMLLCVHGEVTAPEVDIFEREPRFLTDVLAPLLGAHPQLRVVLEHITTREAVDFVNAAGPNVGATITVHHLMYNRNGAPPAARLPPPGARRPLRHHYHNPPPFSTKTSSLVASAPTATACPSSSTKGTARRCSPRWLAAAQSSSWARTLRRTMWPPRSARAAPLACSLRTRRLSCTQPCLRRRAACTT